MKVINHSLNPITLEDGTIVAASGTDGSVKDVALSEKDQRRYVRPDMLAIIDVPQQEVTPTNDAAEVSAARKRESK
jgi:hypothetical protein